MNRITLSPQNLTLVRPLQPRVVSYNIEMTEVTGGRFWKPYTPAQIAGTEPFPQIKDFSEAAAMMQWFPPLDLRDSTLIRRAKEIGPSWVRCSGSWANDTYFDWDGHTGGIPPEGFSHVLAAEQWGGLLDFVQSVGARLLISAANCAGVHGADGSWQPDQMRRLLDFARRWGTPVAAAEFMNEPNLSCLGGAPKGYTRQDFCRDQDKFFRFLRSEYPEVLCVGPCASTNTDGVTPTAMKLDFWSSEELMPACREQPDVFSYHCYTGMSERGEWVGSHWPVESATQPDYLAVPVRICEKFVPLRDCFCPLAPMWVTESADAGCGGNTWASTFLDVIRYAVELGDLTRLTDIVVFHSTLTSSDYGLLSHDAHMPRPSWWFLLLWHKLVGNAVLAAPDAPEGSYLYAFSRNDGGSGATYLLVNPGQSSLTVCHPSAAVYTLSADMPRSATIRLNGEPLIPAEDGSLPPLHPQYLPAGDLTLPPCTVSFLVCSAQKE